MTYRPPEDLTTEELRVLRTQDIGYLYSALQKEKKVRWIGMIGWFIEQIV